MSAGQNKRLGVLTSGGDAQGMNAALRAIVRTAIERGLEVFAIFEGYQGMVDGGDRIRKMDWDAVGGILHKGGTIIGTARCEAFRTHEGRLQAARNLLDHEIDNLIVIGGDGSLTGANLFRQEWPGLLKELAEKDQINRTVAESHPNLVIVGLVGSIDNDFYGTDMTIGADTALHRITEALDAITSTAASHQRTFVVKVMGRNCGYLAMMSALASGADWVLIPEHPPTVDNWKEVMCERIRAGRKAGRRSSIVILAEGARDRFGNYIGSTEVQQALEEGLGEDVRTTVLGHVQRGGVPCAYDRTLGTLMGYAAAEAVLNAKPDNEPVLIGIKGNRITQSPLMECISNTQAVADAIDNKDYEKAMGLRTGSFKDAWRTLMTFVRTLPRPLAPGQKRFRLAVLNAGAPAPGMNTATRAAVRLGIDNGHIMLGIRNGFDGLVDCEVQEMDWMSVSGWVSIGGSELGTSRMIPKGSELYSIARTIENNGIQGLLVIGGWPAYEAAYKLFTERENFPSFNIPMVCLPASINNNLPGSEFSIGADTALNSIVEAVDKIKQSAVASRRVFIVEVMGHYCGYLALLGALATGAERVYLNEEGITIKDLTADVENLVRGFKSGKRLGLMIRNEYANEVYTTPFICALFEEEGRDLFDVRQTILGHLQQGGDPSPFDRIQATRLARLCVDYLIEECDKNSNRSSFIGLQAGHFRFQDMQDFPRLVDQDHQRPKEQWWMNLRPIAKLLAQQGPSETVKVR
jgi:6-phosphofructokinase 1